MDVDLKDNTECTPLMFAAESGHVQVVQLLLGWNDVNVNSRDRNGNTPLSLATMYSRLEVV